MVNISGKRILYVSSTWFHYDKRIIDKLTELGGIVVPFDIDIHSTYYEIIKRLKMPDRMKMYESNYYDRLLLKRDFDYVLVRYGFQFDIGFIEKLRLANPNARFINFHWDSLKKYYNYLPIINCFDKVYSFDYQDCQVHTEIEYLPLFYLDEYANNKNFGLNNKAIDVLFIGAWRNKARYDLIKITEKKCKENNLSFHYYLLSPLIRQFYYFKENGITQKDAKSKKLSHKEILALFAVSKAVIDFPSTFQTGLTMRCFETLAAGLKLITTNKYIRNEPFYNPEYINIIDTDNFKLDIDFINNTPTLPIKDVISKYSIGNYVNKLLQ